MESPSRIFEALADVRDLTDGSEPESLHWLADAARFPTLLYKDCGECGGKGGWDQFSASIQETRWHPCPSCGGSGVVPKEEVIEIGAEALVIADSSDLPSAGNPWWNLRDADRNEARRLIRAVLMALRTIGDEG